MNEGVNPEPKLQGSFEDRGTGAKLCESAGFIVFASCCWMAPVSNLGTCQHNPILLEAPRTCVHMVIRDTAKEDILCEFRRRGRVI